MKSKSKPVSTPPPVPRAAPKKGEAQEDHERKGSDLVGLGALAGLISEVTIFIDLPEAIAGARKFLESWTLVPRTAKRSGSVATRPKASPKPKGPCPECGCKEAPKGTHYIFCSRAAPFGGKMKPKSPRGRKAA